MVPATSSHAVCCIRNRYRLHFNTLAHSAATVVTETNERISRNVGHCLIEGLLTTISIVSNIIVITFGESNYDVRDFSTHKLINISLPYCSNFSGDTRGRNKKGPEARGSWKFRRAHLVPSLVALWLLAHVMFWIEDEGFR